MSVSLCPCSSTGRRLETREDEAAAPLASGCARHSSTTMRPCPNARLRMSEAANGNANANAEHGWRALGGFLPMMALVALVVAMVIPRLRRGNRRGSAALGALLLADAGSSWQVLDSSGGSQVRPKPGRRKEEQAHVSPKESPP